MDRIPAKGFRSFKEFYPYYLHEHRDRTCKVLHFTGTAIVFGLILLLSVLGKWTLAWLLPLAGYGFAWVGHFFFEKNRPATFKYPLYSLSGDFLMFFHLLTGRLGFSTDAPLKR